MLRHPIILFIWYHHKINVFGTTSHLAVKHYSSAPPPNFLVIFFCSNYILKNAVFFLSYRITLWNMPEFLYQITQLRDLRGKLTCPKILGNIDDPLLKYVSLLCSFSALNFLSEMVIQKIIENKTTK